MRKQTATQDSQICHSTALITDHVKQDKYLSDVNKRLSTLRNDIERLKIPDFGSGLYGLSADSNSCVFHNRHTIIASTVADRILSKFESPDFRTQQRLHAECMESWVDFETNHLAEYEFRKLSIRGRSVVYRSRELISKWLYRDHIRTGVSFWSSLEDAPIDFGPGESFSPSQGDTSVFSKIDFHSIFPRWTVTLDYALHASFLIAANKGLRSQAALFLKKKRYPSDRTHLGYNPLHEMWVEKSPGLVSKRIWYFARRVFREIFCAYPLHHPNCLIKMGSRGSSVYKNTSKRRFIEIQCLMNIIGQKLEGYAIRQCLKVNAKIDLDDGQAYHRFLIRDKSVSTIDESNASDSNLWSTTQELFSGALLQHTRSSRSEFILLKRKVVEKSGAQSEITSWHPIRKLSSMGNGYTFEYLSLILGAVTRLFDPRSSVYGDDIICSNETVEQIVDAIREIGFIVNEKKSFLNKPFRESCGSFYLDDYGYIQCFDIKWCHNLNDVINQVNKLGRIVRGNPDWVHPCKNLIESAWSDLLCSSPAFLRGPVVTSTDLPQWIESETWLRIHKTSKFIKRKFKVYRTLCSALLEHWQLYKGGEYPLRYDHSWSVILVPQLVPVLRKKARYADLDANSALMYAYLHSGRVVDMQIRSQVKDQVWAFKPTLVHSSGVFLRAGTARRVCAEFDPKKNKHDEKKRIMRDNIRRMRLFRLHWTKRRSGN